MDAFSEARAEGKSFAAFHFESQAEMVQDYYRQFGADPEAGDTNSSALAFYVRSNVLKPCPREIVISCHEFGWDVGATLMRRK